MVEIVYTLHYGMVIYIFARSFWRIITISALHCPATLGNLELFQYLVENGCDVYRQKKHGINCFHFAIWFGHLHLWKKLLENYSFNMQMTDDDGWSALHCEALSGNLELFQYLVGNSYNVYRQEGEGGNVYMLQHGMVIYVFGKCFWITTVSIFR